MKHISRTEHSIPWNAADRQLVPIDLDRYGYDEEEYFFSGKANVYTLNGDHAEMKSEAAPYTNRFLIRKPKDMKKFSGKVVMELINPTNGWDVVPMWCQIWPSILQDGDIYVGITIREGCIASLKKYDPERYAELDWTNPNKEPGEISKKILMWQHCSKETEYGLFWDMLTQLGYFFKEKNQSVNPGKILQCEAGGLSTFAFVRPLFPRWKMAFLRHKDTTYADSSYLCSLNLS